LGNTCPQNLRDISEQTGGQWFESVTTLEQAIAVYQTDILQTAQGGIEPCDIEWESGMCLLGRQLRMSNYDITGLGITANSSYQTPNDAIARLEFDPAYLRL
jgi:hypothetical protein